MKQRQRKGIEEFPEFRGQICHYCMQHKATTADHFVPWSITRDNRLANMVPCCARCNRMASANHFETFEEKREFVLALRAESLSLVEVYCPNGCGVTYARKGVNDECPDCGEVL